MTWMGRIEIFFVYFSTEAKACESVEIALAADGLRVPIANPIMKRRTKVFVMSKLLVWLYWVLMIAGAMPGILCPKTL